MANITNVLNEQIRRVAKREIKSDTGVVRRATAQYRRDIAELKRQVASLSKTVAFLEKQEGRRVVQRPVAAEVGEDVRFRADGLKSQRKRLGLSAKDYGLLVGVTGQTIYDWEMGKSKPRQEQVTKVAAARGIGKRDALKRLEILGGSAGQSRLRGQFQQTAEQLITALIKGKKATSSAQLNAAWKDAGRGGKADNTLSQMVKSGSLTRAKLTGERGSKYAVS